MRFYLFVYLLFKEKKLVWGSEGRVSSPKELMALLPFVWRKKEGAPERGELGDVSLEASFES